MPEHLIDFTALRADLRALSRSSLLIIAERAIELMPAVQLSTLLSDFVRVETSPSEASHAPLSLAEEAQVFCDAAKAGKYYETVQINNGSSQQQSEGTDAFIAEFYRLLHKCIRAAVQEVPSRVCASFAPLLGLLRYIDEGNDDVLFFPDDGSSLDVGVNWRIALPAYFKCVAKTSSPEDFARTVVEAIADCVDYDQPWYWELARNVANDAQCIALDALIT